MYKLLHSVLEALHTDLANLKPQASALHARSQKISTCCKGHHRHEGGLSRHEGGELNSTILLRVVVVRPNSCSLHAQMLASPDCSTAGFTGSTYSLFCLSTLLSAYSLSGVGNSFGACSLGPENIPPRWGQ